MKEPKEQVGLLQAFMNLFMDETFVENYKKQETPQNIYELITNYI
ncbi:PTS sugar transporter subunit IIA [Enterococcus faecium]|nr:PTS sugar transporter subunit IIA [Enterococcus faecium]